MAKRKRLTAPDPARVSPPQEAPAMHPNDIPAGIIPRQRAPIADVAGQASAVAALEKVAAEMTAARSEGRMVVKLPLEAVSCNYLTRDRVALDESEMEVLTTSLRARGQQTPIEVVQTTPGQYGLISGFRRVQALRALSRSGGDDTVLALVRQPADAAQAYTAMVEENEIRAGLSYYERAHIVRAAVQGDVFASEGAALKALFASASRAKRSKIKSFLPVIEQLGTALRHPNALTERTGLALAARLAADAQFAPRLRDRLRKAQPDQPEAEQALLLKALGDKTPADKTLGGKTAAGTNTPARASAAEPAAADAPVVMAFKPGTLRLTGRGVTPALADKIRALLAEG